MVNHVWEASREAAKQIEALGDEIFRLAQPLLSGEHPAVQGGALANLVALWLASHGIPDDIPATRAMRAALLENFLHAVKRLLPICAEELGTPHDPIEPDPGPETFRWQ
jgi:hypothetical protein